MRTVDVSAVKHHVLQHLPVSPAVPVSCGPLQPFDTVFLGHLPSRASDHSTCSWLKDCGLQSVTVQFNTVHCKAGCFIAG